MTLVQDTLQPEPQFSMSSPRRERAVTILAVDDHPGFLEALEDLIAASPDFVLVGEALSGEDAVRDAERLSPQMILMDVVMPGMGGIAAARAIRSRSSDVAILLISVDDPVGYLADEDLGCAVACLRKQDLSPSELKHAWELLHQ